MKVRAAYFGVFTALALIFSYVESLIPFHIGIPGVKLGLANLIIVIALYKMNVKAAYLLSVTRVVLSGFMFGSLFGILYSLAGGLLSLTVMAVLKKSNGFSVMGVSIAGGVSHNIGQLVVAILVVETYSVMYYLPVLLTAGLITGLLIGITANEMLKRLAGLRTGFEG
ncbi:MAG: Gx transporter family protein [Dorea sp.]|nr:Gx transporter family protein [Dorea sp.]